MDFNEENPLGQQFENNPLEFMQFFVRNMNNEIFLSEYHINNLYALLLISRGAPWDNLKPGVLNFKEQIDMLVEGRVKEVKFLLEKLSQVYEDKVKKNTFNQIQRLMSIIRAKNKSIFIQKYFEKECACHFTIPSQTENQTEASNENNENEEKVAEENQQIIQQEENRSMREKQFEEKPKNYKQNEKTEENKCKEGQEKMEQEPICLQHQLIGGKESSDMEVFGLFAGLANIPNLSTLALGNCLEYNSIERFIKFKMSRNYIMTIQNNDPVFYDRDSSLRELPAHTYTHHIFPYLTATQLFAVRGVCKEWLSHVKQAWHSTFKREMYIQLMACEFCKDIQFYYKCIQLRNPFFQKLSLLMHALMDIIQWDTLAESLNNGTISMALKRVLLVLLKLLGEDVKVDRVNDLTEEVWNTHQHKIVSLKERVSQFFTNLNGTNMSINELRHLKTNILDHPFLRGEQLHTEDKTPLLLLIFIKQLTLQQVIKNHLFFSQEYLLNSKKRLDGISAKMPQQRGFLEGVYKILLLRGFSTEDEGEDDRGQMPNLNEMIQSIFENKQTNKPDFTIRTRASKTDIYMDRATKLDIIISTVKKIHSHEDKQIQETVEQNNQQTSQNKEQRNKDSSQK